MGVIFTAAILASALIGSSPADGKRLALLVGVKEYRHSELETLQYTERDVDELSKELTRSGFKVTVLSTAVGKKDASAAPTKANIERSVKALLENVGRDDLVLVGLAGHGLQPTGSSEQYFCPSDANPATKANLVSLAKVSQEMQDSGAGAKLLLVDACRNDPDPSRGRSGVEGNTYSLPPRASNFMAMFSCCAGQRAYETPKAGEGHGVFFYHVIKGLRGEAKDQHNDNEVTWDSLSTYVKRRVPLSVKSWVGTDREQRVHAIANVDRDSVVIARFAKRNWLQAPKVRTADDAELIREDLRRDAAAGDVGAKMRLGHMLMWGVHWTTVDTPTGLALLRGAANTGDPTAQIMFKYAEWNMTSHDEKLWERTMKPALLSLKARSDLSSLSYEYLGVGFAWFDRATSHEMIRKAVEGGEAGARGNLGDVLLDGLGVVQNEREGFGWYRSGAELGDAGCMISVGDCLLEGRGTIVDHAAGVEWLRKAAALKHSAAMYSLGVCHENGTGVEENAKEAVKWFQQSADLGHSGAMTYLGTKYVNGAGVEKNEEEGVQWYRKAAALHNEVAMYSLGVCYESGQGVAKDEKIAAEWYLNAAENDNTDGMTSLAALYWDGRGVERNDVEAAKWYKKAAEMGGAVGMTSYGTALHEGRGVEKNAPEAVKWYLKAADKGEAIAMNTLGNCYANGQGVAKDHAAAFGWYKKAADKNNTDAINRLGDCYLNGTGVEADEAEAVKWYRKGVELDDRLSMTNLAWCYANGKGVERSDEQALRWYVKAAEKGDPSAMASAGNFYWYGRGAEKNYAEAVKWYRKAAEKENAVGMYGLGYCYEYGNGVEKDQRQAIDWYKRASAKGDEDSKKALERLGIKEGIRDKG